MVPHFNWDSAFLLPHASALQGLSTLRLPFAFDYLASNQARIKTSRLTLSGFKVWALVRLSRNSKQRCSSLVSHNFGFKIIEITRKIIITKTTISHTRDTFNLRNKLHDRSRHINYNTKFIKINNFFFFFDKQWSFYKNSWKS